MVWIWRGRTTSVCTTAAEPREEQRKLSNPEEGSRIMYAAVLARRKSGCAPSSRESESRKSGDVCGLDWLTG